MGDWRKSTYSDANGGNCIEVGGALRVVMVRDTTDRDGAVIEFTPNAWQAFTDSLK
jgi:hypothetical protein